MRRMVGDKRKESKVKLIRCIHNLTTNSLRRAYGKFKDLNLWRGPSLDFHSMTISYLRQKQQLPNFSYVSLLQDQDFLILLYGTLATWGLHRMGAKRRMVGFNIFKQQMDSIAKLLDDIKGITLLNCTLGQIESEKEKILVLFKKPRVTQRIRKIQQVNNQAPLLIANSKLLHHVHPDLLPPIDREYIVRYFYSKNIDKKTVYVPESVDRQAEWFWKILIEYKNFCDSHHKIVGRFLEQNITGMETSTTKIIDNIVVGHTAVIMNKPIPS